MRYIGGNFVAVGVADSRPSDEDGDRQELLRRERDGGGPYPAVEPPSWSPDHRSFKSFVETMNSTLSSSFSRQTQCTTGTNQCTNKIDTAISLAPKFYLFQIGDVPESLHQDLPYCALHLISSGCHRLYRCHLCLQSPPDLRYSPV
ncbi:hypothetical protein ACFX2F_025747 [Malus domestica]